MTGQLFVRGPYDGPGSKKVYIVAGLVCSEEQELQGETLYTIGTAPVLIQPQSIKQWSTGQSVDGLLKAPIWRI